MSVAKRFNAVTAYDGFSLPFMLRFRLKVSPITTCSALLRKAFPDCQFISRDDSLMVLSSNCDLLLHIRKQHLS